MARLSINESDDWHVKNDAQDIRGWPAFDATGSVIGHVSDLVADTQSKLVETIVLDNGKEYPAADVELTGRTAYVEGAPSESAEAEPAVMVYDKAEIKEREEGAVTGFAKHEPKFREHYRSTYADSGEQYSEFHPAYRMGYDMGMLDKNKNRGWDDAEPEIRSNYEDTYMEGTWSKVRDAARHGFERAQSFSSKR